MTLREMAEQFMGTRPAPRVEMVQPDTEPLNTFTVRMIVTVAVPASSREHAMAIARSSFHTLRATVVSAQDAEVQS